jgi:hypothetical protein
MFVNPGARDLLLQGERQKFLTEDWPRIHANIQRLGLKAEELLNGAKPSSDSSPSKTAESNPADSPQPNPRPGSNTKKEER